MVQFIPTVRMGLCALGLAAIAGCGTGTPSGPQAQGPGTSAHASITAPSTAPAPGEDHGHKPGQHGGIMISIGTDSYHAEAVFQKGGQLRLITLDKDETKLLDVERQTLTAYVKVEGEPEAESFELSPSPQPGDAEGKTTQFAGQMPARFAGQPVEVTIPVLRIGKERFRLGFKSVAEAHQATQMPEGTVGDGARQLYLSPGGKYSAADIKANGNQTAEQKFKGVKASHDLNPKAGDKICPITMTKANPQFTWVVGGQAYEFCCPPCVDEFVKLAKDKPAEVQPPEKYVKKGPDND